MSRLRAATLVFAGILPVFLPSQARASRELTFEQRVDAQRAIERVYYGHQVASGQPFEAAVPREVLENKVRAYLAQSAALERIWHEALTPEHLRAELHRIVKATRFPDRLREVYQALGNDSFVIQECFVRPALVSRLARNFFASDRKLQSAARREADEIFDRLASRRLDARAEHRDRTVEEVASQGGPQGDIGRPSPVVEERDAFTVNVVLSQNADVTRVATYTVPKRGWDDWWREVSGSLSQQKVAAVASELLTVPEIAAAGSSCVPDDTWSNGILDDVPDPRHDHSAVWTGSEMLVWGGQQGPGHPYLDSGARYDPLTDSWSPITRVGAPLARARHLAVWTGSAMVVWGGTNATVVGEQLTTGGRYDPVADSWTPTSNVNAPERRDYTSFVWTGTQLIVWGGAGGANGVTPLNSGGRYDPVNDVWTPTSTTNAPSARHSATAVWTGSVMIVWGGLAAGFLNSGGCYDPSTDSWTAVNVNGAPNPRRSHSAIWTGSKMVVWAGSDAASSFNTGGRYDPAANAWAPTSLVNAPSKRVGHKAVWVSGFMVVWGGGDGTTLFNDGKRYDPVADLWMPVSTVNAPGVRENFSVVASEDRMLVWGGDRQTPIPPQEFSSGGRYDPSTDTWTSTSMGSGPAPGQGRTAVWTGNTMILWGAQNEFSNFGSRYDPLVDAWTPTTTNGAPAPRSTALVVWAGGRMVVWGGSEGSPPLLNTGSRYDPISDQWQATSTSGAPTGRQSQAAVSTGDSMIVWGRSAQFSLENPGGVYTVATDSWSPMTSAGTPSVRSSPSVVWAGDRMIVWGGYSGGVDLADGASYDPAANAWMPVASAGAPSARRSHTAVWTGSEMIIWGGQGGSSYPVDGGRYDPSTDAWHATSADGAPEGRIGSSAVWTGSGMVIWGGLRSTVTDTGGRYDPASDSWTATSTSGAPAPRSFHAAVWSGTAMIVWGGVGGTYFASGGLYYALDDSDGDCVARASDNCPNIDNPDQEDGDQDGSGDACDCAPADPSAFAPPGEVGGVGWQPGSWLRWDSIAAGTGTGVSYDVERGTIGTWPVGSGSESYLATAMPSTSLVVLESPDPGAGLFYLVRGRNACGNSGFGIDSAGHVRGSPAAP